MPGPGGKKRLGSRRRVAPQVEMPEDFSIADKLSEPEESGESFSVLSNEDHTPLKTNLLLSSEQKSSRRKLGSNRQSKRENSQQSAIESYHKPTKEVEQNVHTEKLQAAMIPVGQAVREGEFSEVDYDSVYGTHLYSAHTSGHALDPSYLDSDVERHKCRSEKMHLDQGARESDCKADIAHNKQVDNTGKQWSVKQKLHDQSNLTEIPVQHTFIDAEKEEIIEDLPLPAVAFQGDYLNVKLNEIDVQGNPERPPEKSSCCEKLEIRNSVEQVNYSPAPGELPSNEEHEPFDFSQVRSDRLPYQNEMEEIKSSKSDQKEYLEIVTCGAQEDLDKCLEDRTDEMAQLDVFPLSVKSPTDSYLNPQDKQEEQLLKEKTGGLYQKDNYQAHDNDTALIITEKMETTPCQEKDINNQVKANLERSTDGVMSTMMDCVLSSQSVQPERGFVFDSQSQDNNASTDEQRESFSPARNSRNLESSRRSKRTHDAVTDCDSKADAIGKTSNDGDELPKMKEMTFTTGAAEKKKIQLKGMDNLNTFLGEDMHDLVTGNAHSNSTIPQQLTRPSNCEEMPEEVRPIDKAKTKAGDEKETFSKNGKFGDILEISMPESSFNEDKEIEFSVAIATISSPKAETPTDEHEHFSFSQVGGAQLPDEDLIEEVKLLETDRTKDSGILVDGPTGDVDKNTENLVNEIFETHMSDLSMKSARHSGLNPQDNAEEHHMEENNTEVLEQRDENNFASNTEETPIITEKTDPTQSQEHDNETQGMLDLEESAKGILNGMAQSKFSSLSVQPEKSFVFDSESELNAASTDEQRDSRSRNMNRRKLGSSRRSKRSEVKVIAAERYSDFEDDAVGETRDDDDDDPGEIKEVTMNVEAGEKEKSELKGMDNLDTFQDEDETALVRGNAYSGFPAFITSNPHSNTTVSQLLTEQSHPRKMQEEEDFLIAQSKMKAGEENETLVSWNENVPAEYSLSQPLVDAQVFATTLAISTSESSLNKKAEIEFCVATDTISSPKVEMSADEQYEHLSCSQVSAAQHPGKDVIHEAKLLEMVKTDSEMLIDGPTGDVDKNTENLEVLETHISDYFVNSSVDSGLDPQDNPKEHHMGKDNMEVSEQREETDHAFNSIVTWTNTENADPTQSQEHDNEAQGTSDVEQSARRIFIGMTESELSSQSVQPVESFVLDSQSEDNTASTHEQKDSLSQDINRRKLGSSRRNKKSKVKVFATETYSVFKDDAVGETRDDDDHLGEIKDVTFKIETDEKEKSELKEMDNSDTLHGEHATDLVGRSSQAGFSEFITSNTLSNTTLPQLLTEQSNSWQMSEKEEVPIVKSKPKAEEENETFPQNENVHADYLVSQALVDAEVSVATLQISTPKSSLDNDAEIECNVAKATISSPKAETSKDEQHEHFSFSQVRDAHFEDLILIKKLESSEIDQNEDCEIWSTARNRRKLGSSRRKKGTGIKDFAPETYNESTDNAAKNDSDKDDPPVIKDMTFTIESAEMENTEKNRHNEATDIECGPTNATISLSEEEMEEQRELSSISGGCSAQHLEIGKMLKQKVHPVEVNEPNHTDDSAVKEVCSPAGIMQMGASADCEALEKLMVEGAQNAWDKTLPVAAETAGQLASQDHMKPIFTEKIVVEVVKSQIILEEDSMSPNSEKDDIAASQGEVPDTARISHQRTNVCSTSSLNVQSDEENRDCVSLKEESLENVIEAEKGAQEKAVEEIRANSEPTGLYNESLTPTKKRKMGSTRRSRMNGKQEADMDGENDTRALENRGVLGDVPQIEAVQRQSAKSSCEEEQEFNKVEADPKRPNSTGESDMLPATNDAGTAFSEQVSAHDAKSANLFTSQVADVRGSDRDVMACMETFEPDYVPVSVPVDTEGLKKQQLLSNRSGIDSEHDVNAMQGQDATERHWKELMVDKSNIQVIKTESDTAPDKHLKSPSLNLTSKKRKMGSTRRNLGAKSKGDLELNLDLSNEVPVTALVQNVMTDRNCQSKDKKLKPESSGSKPTDQENAGEAPSTALVRQTSEENQTLEHHPVRFEAMEKQSTSAKLEMLSEFGQGGRKRKLGSHRRSRVQQTPRHQSEDGDMPQKQPERVFKTTTREQVDDTIQGSEESQSHLQSNIGDTKPSANISKSVRSEEVTPPRVHQDRVHLGQDTRNVSFGKSADLNANPFNVVMVGDSNVGKTSFMKRAQNGKFFPDLPASAGLDTCLWTVVVDGRPVVLQLWDTAGQERFRSITNQVFHRAHAFLLMYDITSTQSFTAVHYWARCIQEGAMENVPVLLLGNKSDHAERRVTTEEGQNVAKKLNTDFMECSAVSGDNVIQSLEAVARLLSHKDDGRDETLVLHKASPKKKAGCC